MVDIDFKSEKIKEMWGFFKEHHPDYIGQGEKLYLFADRIISEVGNFDFLSIFPGSMPMFPIHPMNKGTSFHINANSKNIDYFISVTLEEIGYGGLPIKGAYAISFGLILTRKWINETDSRWGPNAFASIKCHPFNLPKNESGEDGEESAFLNFMFFLKGAINEFR